MGLNLSASLACGEGSVLHAVLKLDALSVSPGDVIAEALPVALEVVPDVLSEGRLLNFGLDQFLNLAFDGVSSLLPLLAILIVKGQHVVVGPAVHLDWEDCRLEGKSGEAQLLNPWLEVEAVDGWDGVVLLARFDLVVVLAWRVQTQEHSLGAQDGCVVP